LRFALFLLVNAMLYVRPAEIFPALLGQPVYEACIVACLVASYPALLKRMTLASLAARPLDACVAGLLPAIVLSLLANLEPAAAFNDGEAFAKVLLYYFLLVTVVDTPARLERLLAALATFSLVITSLALLHFYAVIDLPALRFIESPTDDTGSPAAVVRRLGSTGLFQDPNDMCLMLVMAMTVCVYQVVERRRYYWAAPLVVFGLALRLTYSRGGFLGLLAAVGVLLVAKYGRKAVPLGLVVIPAVLFAFAGRQTSFSEGLSEGTGATRLDLWAEGLAWFVRRPVFGIGSGAFAPHMGHVAHNSFIHAYVELGMVGGTLFLGAFYLAVWPLVRLGRAEVPADLLGDDLVRLRPYVLAIAGGYVAGLASLSNCYYAPTYAVFGLSATYTHLAEARLGVPVARLNGPMAKRLALISVAFAVTAVVGVRLVHRG
jgi:putative inorganic carbon (hco3(-)) transporter